MLSETALAGLMAESARATMAAYAEHEMLDHRRTNPASGGGRPARRQDEILAAMRTKPDHAWTAAEVAAALHTWAEDNIRRVMDRMEAKGLILSVSLSAGPVGRAKSWKVAG